MYVVNGGNLLGMRRNPTDQWLPLFPSIDTFNEIYHDRLIIHYYDVKTYPFQMGVYD